MAELKEQCVSVCCLLCIFNSSFFIFDNIVGGFSQNDSFEVQLSIKN